jgi:hypothetical protein
LTVTNQTLEELRRLHETATDDKDRAILGAVLDLESAFSIPDAEIGEPELCALCLVPWPAAALYALWPESDRYGPGLCPFCRIAAYCEAPERSRRERSVNR